MQFPGLYDPQNALKANNFSFLHLMTDLYIPDELLSVDLMREIIHFIEQRYVKEHIENPLTVSSRKEAETLRDKACKILAGGDGWVDFGLDVYCDSLRLQKESFYQAFRAAASYSIVQARKKYEKTKNVNPRAPLVKQKICNAQSDYAKALNASSLSWSIYYYNNAIRLIHESEMRA